MKFQLKLPDIILTAAYTAVYFLITGIAAMITVFIIPGYSFIFIPTLVALLSGPIFYLLALKVPKFGAITFMASIMGIFYLVSGRYPVSIFVSIIFGLLADKVAGIGNYRSKSLLLLSYILFSFNNIGPVLPMFVFPTSYAKHVAGTGQNLTTAQKTLETITKNSAIAVAATILVTAVIGALVGQMLVNKHFKKENHQHDH